jgi:hypothetical protein
MQPLPTPAAPNPPAQRPKKKIDDMLPPSAAAGAAAPVPPTPAPASVPATVIPATVAPAPIAPSPPPSTAPKKPTAESLLPASKATISPSETLAQIALPEAEMAQQLKELQRPKLPAQVPEGTILLPTDDGYVAVRESAKTVGSGYEERELNVLPPELKRKRRWWRNFVMYAFGLVLLAIIFAALMRV